MFCRVQIGAFVAIILCMALTPRLNAQAPKRAIAAAPISFERNVGQTDKSVQFLSRGSGYTLFVKPDEAVFSLKKRHGKTAKSEGTGLRMRLEGANAEANALPFQPLRTTSNYLIGDRAHWRTGVPNYAKAGFSNVYPGVDVVYYGNEGGLEYDFVVSPAANPSQIKLRFAGAKSVKVLPNGELTLTMGGGSLRWRSPVAYQDLNGKRNYVKAEYSVQHNNYVCFRVGAYDTSKPLIIDPKLLYSTYLGGSNEDVAYGIAVDSAGSAYITGTTYSADFPTTAGSFQSKDANGSDVFVAKLSPDGKSLLYSTYIGGGANESGNAILVDSAGNAYIAGQTYSSNFPVTNNAFQGSLQGGADAFLTVLSANGQALVYSTYLGGSLDDSATCIALGSANSIYVGGWANSTNFPTTAGAFRAAHSGGAYDGFVVKFASLGDSPSYATYLGGAGADQINGIAVDSAGNAYVTGTTSSGNFPVTAKALRTVFSGYPSAFVSKISNAGDSLVYSTYLNATGWVLGSGIAVDSSGSAYITGAAYALDYLTTDDAFQTKTGRRFDAFVTKLNPSGNKAVYSTYLGGAGDDIGSAIALDSSGNAFVTGQTYSSNFPTTSNSFQTGYAGGVDSFVAQLSGNGQRLLYSTYLGGAGDDVARDIALDSGGKAYIAGYTSSSNLPVTAGAYQSVNFSFSGTAFVTGIPGLKDTEINAPPVTGGIGQTVALIAVLARSRDSAAIPNESLIFSIDGARIGAATTDNTGTASLTYTLDENFGAGAHLLTVAFAADDGRNPSSATTNLTINKATTTLSMSDVVGRVGDVALFVAQLTRNTDTHPIVNRAVAFSLDGAALGSATTDSKGNATFAYTITETTGVGSHTIALAFVGDTNYIPSNDTANLTVRKTDTALKASDMAGIAGSSVNFTAALTRSNDNSALQGKTVSFAIDGVSIGSSTTDSTGVATVAYTPSASLAGAAHTLVANFAGDSNYNASSASNSLRVTIDTALTTSDSSAKYGKTVTFIGVLTQKPSLKGLASQTLAFQLDGITIGKATTNSKGVAALAYRLNEGLPVGAHTLTVAFAGSPPYNPSTGSATFTANRADTNVTASAPSGAYGKTLNFAGVLKRITDGSRLANQTLSFFVDGSSIGQDVTDSKGGASLSYQIPESLSLGSHTLAVQFAGTTQYNASAANASFTVSASATSITMANVSNFYGKTAGISAQLRRKTDNASIPNQSLIFKIDGAAIGQATTDAAGKAILSYRLEDNLPVGVHALTVAFAGTTNYTPSTASATLTVNATDTSIFVKAPSGAYGKILHFTGILKRVTDSKKLANQTLSFFVGGSSVGQAVTDSTGSATINYPIQESLALGSHSLTVQFARTSQYNASSTTASFTVSAANTSLELENVSAFYGKTVGFTAQLKRKTDDAPLASQTITFKLDGVAIGSALTNASGKAPFSLKPDDNLAPGRHALSAEFAGNALYNASKGTSTLTLNQTATTFAASSLSGNQGATVNILAKLKRGTDGKGVSGRTVDFSVDGVSVGTAVTDTTGIATLAYTIPANAAKGLHPLSYAFAGDAYYTGSVFSGTNLNVK